MKNYLSFCYWSVVIWYLNPMRVYSVCCRQSCICYFSRLKNYCLCWGDFRATRIGIDNGCCCCSNPINCWSVLVFKCLDSLYFQWFIHSSIFPFSIFCFLLSMGLYNFLFFGCNCFGLGFSLHLLMEIGKLQTSHWLIERYILLSR